MGIFSSRPYGKNRPSIPDSLDDDSDYMEIRRQELEHQRKLRLENEKRVDQRSTGFAPRVASVPPKRLFDHDPSENRTTVLSWHVTGVDPDQVEVELRHPHYANYSYRSPGDTVFFVEASINQMTVLFNDHKNVTTIVRAVPGKEPVKRVVARPSDLHTLLVYNDLVPLAIEQLNRYKSCHNTMTWSDPNDRGEEFTLFYVKAPIEVLDSLSQAGFTKALYADRMFTAC